MAEVLFYRLSSSPIEAALPDMLEKCLERGWRVQIRTGSDAGAAFLDERLWTYRDDAFLPHGVASGDHAARQPILIGTVSENLNRADVLMLTLGARAPVADMAAFVRACVVFDGADTAVVEAAREDWRGVVAAGLPAAFWAQEEGRWVRKASN